MKKVNIVMIVLMLALIGCSQTQEEAEVPAEHNMDDMPCHQMPDGSWMGACDAKETLAKPSIQAESTTIISLDDGDTFTITADEVTKIINGYEVTMYAYNNQIPGPAIKVKQNSTITVLFHNNIDSDTTIHWHGLRQENKNDGVPGVTQDPTTPGASHKYTVYFPDEGIYWYHPHIREDIQQDLGLAGNMLVTPTEIDYYSPVNKEELLVLDDLLMSNGKIVPYGAEHANHALMGRYGNVMLLNGETKYNLEANKGDIIRFHITNVANARPFNLSFSGAKIKLVGGDVGSYEQEEFVKSIIIAPAERYTVEVYFEEEKTYNIQNINPEKTYNLGTIIIKNQTINDYSSTFLTLHQNNYVIDDISSFKKYFDKPVDHEIILDVNLEMHNIPCHKMGDRWMGDCDKEVLEENHQDEEEHHQTIEWEDDMAMMNSMMTTESVKWVLRDTATKNENMNIKYNWNVGDKIKLRLINKEDSDHPMQHPIHLHGQRFLVIETDGIPNKNLVWKDTTLVPVGSTVDILVDVTNPGEWMMHCHIAEHLESGMMASFVVE